MITLRVTCTCGSNEVDSNGNIFHFSATSKISYYKEVVIPSIRILFTGIITLSRTAGHYRIFMQRRVHHSNIKQIV